MLERRLNRPELATARTVIELLVELFPAAFSVCEGRRRALKVGVRLAIVERLGGGENMPFSEHELDLGLRRYCQSDGYLHALAAGRRRVDLDGLPQGAVLSSEQANAKMRLALRQARRRPSAGPARPAAPAPTRRRLPPRRRPHRPAPTDNRKGVRLSRPASAICAGRVPYGVPERPDRRSEVAKTPQPTATRVPLALTKVPLAALAAPGLR